MQDKEKLSIQTNDELISIVQGKSYIGCYFYHWNSRPEQCKRNELSSLSHSISSTLSPP